MPRTKGRKFPPAFKGWMPNGEQECQFLLPIIQRHNTSLASDQSEIEFSCERLASRIKWAKEFPSVFRVIAVRRAVDQCMKKSNLTSAKFLSCLNAACDSLRSKGKSTFEAWTWITVHRNLRPPRRYHVDNIEISFLKRLSNEARLKVENTRQYRPHLREFFPGKHLAILRLRTDSFSTGTAIEGIYSALNFVRGLWVLSLTRGRIHISLGGIASPYNQVTAPFALFFTDMSETPFWTQGNCRVSSGALTDNAEWNRAIDNEKRWRRKLRFSKLNGELREIIELYAQALDVPDYNLSMSRLWMVLEKVALRGDETNHMKIGPRIAALFLDYRHFRMLLDDFRKMRNAYIHELSGGDNSQLILARLNNVVTDVLVFLIEWCERIESLDTLIDILSARSADRENSGLPRIDDLPYISNGRYCEITMTT